MQSKLGKSATCPDAKGVFDGSVDGAERLAREPRVPLAAMSRDAAGNGGPSGAPAGVLLPGIIAIKPAVVVEPRAFRFC